MIVMFIKRGVLVLLSISSSCAAFNFHRPSKMPTVNVLGRVNNSWEFNIMNQCTSTKTDDRTTSMICLLNMSPSSDNDGSSDSTTTSKEQQPNEIEELRETASKLRAEALAQEELMQSSRDNKKIIEGSEYAKPVEYIDLKDSCWEIT